MTERFNVELTKIHKWLQVNKLSINIDKTNDIIFRSKKKYKAPKLNIAIDGNIIEMVNQTKILGVLMDKFLSWKAYINHVASKVAKCIGLLIRGRHIFMTKTLTMLQYAFAHTYFLYCNHVWGNICVTSLDTISKLQNKLVRIIYNSEYDANTEITHKKLKIMKFININKFQKGLSPQKCVYYVLLYKNNISSSSLISQSTNSHITYFIDLLEY